MQELRKNIKMEALEDKFVKNFSELREGKYEVYSLKEKRVIRRLRVTGRANSGFTVISDVGFPSIEDENTLSIYFDGQLRLIRTS